VEQEKIDKLMIEMDGTENKCEWPKVEPLLGKTFFKKEKKPLVRDVYTLASSCFYASL
jgi:hypothetical protein